MICSPILFQEERIGQLHKHFSNEHVAFLFQAYSIGLMPRTEVQETHGISMTCFFASWKEYRKDPETFSITFRRNTLKKIPKKAEAANERELLHEKRLVDDPDLPISGYKYSALRDRL